MFRINRPSSGPSSSQSGAFHTGAPRPPEGQRSGAGKLFDRLGSALGIASTASNIAQSKDAFEQARASIGKAYREPNRENMNQALSTTASSTSTMVGGATGVHDIATRLGDTKLGQRIAGSQAVKPLGKLGGRLVPGANVVVAAADSKVAWDTLKSDASLGKKATAVVSAMGSMAAATNVPGISQVGATVAAGSSLLNTYAFDK